METIEAGRKPSMPSNVKQKKKQIKLQQEWVYECNKLKKRYDVIERQLQSIYRDGNPLSLEFKDIFDCIQLMHTERMKQKKEIQKDLTATSDLINKFQLILTNISSNKQCKSLVLEKMNSLAEQIENKLMKFKTNHQKQLKDLESAENILWKELCATTQRLDTFQQDTNMNMNASKQIASFAKKRILNKSNQFEHDSRPQKLIDLQIQIDEHGRYGGWPQRDHDHFLKLYSQIPSDRELLHQLSEVMPQYTLSEIREHLAWFDQHERLWQYKRQIIKEWKERKKREQDMKNKSFSSEKAVHERIEKGKQKQLNAQREEKRKKVKEWREEKEREETQQIRKKSDRLKQRELKQEKQHKARVREQKKLLLQLSERKKLNELVEKTTIQQCNRNLKKIKDSERNKELLIKFRTKDMLLVSKKKEAINRKQQKERDREWRLVNLIAKSQPDIKAKRNTERLLKMTASTKKRIELKSKEKSKNKSAHF